MADIASVRFSLPAHLLEPTPNLGKAPDSIIHAFAAVNWADEVLGNHLEYWNYLDRPETFARSAR